MRKNLPTINSILVLSLLLGITVVVVKVMIILRAKDLQVRNYQAFFRPLPKEFNTEVFDSIDKREKNLKVSVDEFIKIHEQVENTNSEGVSPAQEESTSITPTPTLTPTTEPTVSPTPSGIPVVTE